MKTTIDSISLFELRKLLSKKMPFAIKTYGEAFAKRYTLKLNNLEISLGPDSFLYSEVEVKNNKGKIIATGKVTKEEFVSDLKMTKIVIHTKPIYIKEEGVYKHIPLSKNEEKDLLLQLNNELLNLDNLNERYESFLQDFQQGKEQLSEEYKSFEKNYMDHIQQPFDDILEEKLNNQKNKYKGVSHLLSSKKNPYSLIETVLKKDGTFTYYKYKNEININEHIEEARRFEELRAYYILHDQDIEDVVVEIKKIAKLEIRKQYESNNLDYLNRVINDSKRKIKTYELKNN